MAPGIASKIFGRRNGAPKTNQSDDVRINQSDYLPGDGKLSMSTLQKLIFYTEDDHKMILKEFNRDPESVKEDVKTIKEWFAAQPHLPKVELTDRRIETMLIYNKMSIEKTKEKLDMFFTVRKILPEFFRHCVPSEQKYDEITKGAYVIPLSRLTKEGYRPILLTMKDTDEEMDISKHAGFIFNINEIRMDNDCHSKLVIILDGQNATLGRIIKYNPMLLKKLMFIIEKCFSERTTAIHVISVPGFVDTLLAMAKPIIRDKLFKRIIFHKTRESLYEHIPQSYFPKEYGGEMMSIDETAKLWYKATLEYEPWLKKLTTLEVDESKRPGKPLNDDILGFHGHFRQLQLD